MRPLALQEKEKAMAALTELLTTDAGLMSLALIAFIICMAGFIGWYVRKQVREEMAQHR
jgi:hypothetical protein